MKSLIFILLALFAFQAIHAQEVEGEIGEAFFEEIEEQPEGVIGEAFTPEEETAIDWVVAPIDDFRNDPFSQQVVRFCAQWMISQLIGFKTISNSSSWNVSQVNSAEFFRAQSLWRINILFDNDDGETFNGEFIVKSSNFISTSIEIRSSTYALGNDEADLAALENEEADIAEFGETPELVNANPAENSGESPLWLGAWSELNVTESRDDPKIEALLNQGVAAAIEKGLAEGTLPQGSWALWRVNGIERQFLAGTNYLFKVTLSGPGEASGEIFVSQELNQPTSWVVSSGFFNLLPIFA